MSFYLALYLFCISTTITPGPNNFMIMMSTLTFGIKKSLPHFFGICLGFTLMVLCIGFGLSSLFTDYPEIHWVIKILGAAYMLFLAVKIMSSSSHTSGKKTAKPLTFFQAALFQWVNPKAWMMSVGVIATYTSTQMQMSMTTQVLIIAIIYLTSTLPCTGTWLIGGHFFKKMLKNNQQVRIFNLVLGCLLIASIILMLFE